MFTIPHIMDDEKYTHLHHRSCDVEEGGGHGKGGDQTFSTKYSLLCRRTPLPLEHVHTTTVHVRREIDPRIPQFIS
jgi:hypothetical protein